MPAYDYNCSECKATATIVNSITKTAVAPTCPDCEIVMVRDFNVGAVTFKGSGFYSTTKGK